MCVHVFIHSFIFSSTNMSWAPALHPTSCAGDLEVTQTTPGPALECRGHTHKPVCPHSHGALWSFSRISPPEWRPWRLLLKCPSGLQVLATLPPLQCNPDCDFITSHISSKQRKLLLLFTSHSLLKGIWGSRMKLLMGGKRVLFLRNDLKTRWHFFAYQIKDQGYST